MTADELLKALAELTEAAQELKDMPSNVSLRGYIMDGLQHTAAAMGADGVSASDLTPEQEGFCARNCCWSGHHKDCPRYDPPTDGVKEDDHG